MCECAELKPGSKILIVRPWFTNELYSKGDILEVANIDAPGVKVRFPGYVDGGDGSDLFYLSCTEFEVIE
jgi:hypothetical protein